MLKFEHGWICERCEAKGTVTTSERHGIWSLYQKIAAQHDAKSKNCEHGAAFIQVHTPRQLPQHFGV